MTTMKIAGAALASLFRERQAEPRGNDSRQ